MARAPAFAPRRDRQCSFAFHREQSCIPAYECGHAAQHSLETRQRIADSETVIVDTKFAYRLLMFARAFLDDRDCAPNAARSLEVAQEKHSVGKIRNIDWRLHFPDEPMLRHRQERRGALPVEVLQQ